MLVGFLFLVGYDPWLLIVPGLNGLAGFNVTGAKVNFSAPVGEPNLSGFAYIPNPSVLTVAMVSSAFPHSLISVNDCAG
jgi:hypothetical protein